MGRKKKDTLELTPEMEIQPEQKPPSGPALYDFFRQQAQQLVTDVKGVVETIEKRFNLVKGVFDDDFRNSDPPEGVAMEDKQQILDSLYMLHINEATKFAKELGEIDKKLGEVLRILK